MLLGLAKPTDDPGDNDPTGAYLGNLVDPTTVKQYQAARAQQGLMGLTQGLLGGKANTFGEGLAAGLQSMMNQQNAFPGQVLQSSQSNAQLAQGGLSRAQTADVNLKMEDVKKITGIEGNVLANYRPYADSQGQSGPGMSGGSGASGASGAYTGKGGSIADQIHGAAKNSTVDPATALATADIESSMGSNLGSRGNVFQLGKNEWQGVGGGQMGHPETDIKNGIAFLGNTQKALAAALGRTPEPWEVYLGHQQGVAGATQIISQPNTAAGQLVGNAAIKGNGGDPGAPASDFAARIRNNFNRRYAAYQGYGQQGGSGQAPTPVSAAPLTEAALRKQYDAQPPTKGMEKPESFESYKARWADSRMQPLEQTGGGPAVPQGGPSGQGGVLPASGATAPGGTVPGAQGQGGVLPASGATAPGGTVLGAQGQGGGGSPGPPPGLIAGLKGTTDYQGYTPPNTPGFRIPGMTEEQLMALQYANALRSAHGLPQNELTNKLAGLPAQMASEVYKDRMTRQGAVSGAGPESHNRSMGEAAGKAFSDMIETTLNGQKFSAPRGVFAMGPNYVEAYRTGGLPAVEAMRQKGGPPGTFNTPMGASQFENKMFSIEHPDGSKQQGLVDPNTGIVKPVGPLIPAPAPGPGSPAVLPPGVDPGAPSGAAGGGTLGPAAAGGPNAPGAPGNVPPPAGTVRPMQTAPSTAQTAETNRGVFSIHPPQGNGPGFTEPVVEPYSPNHPGQTLVPPVNTHGPAYAESAAQREAKVNEFQAQSQAVTSTQAQLQQADLYMTRIGELLQRVQTGKFTDIKAEVFRTLNALHIPTTGRETAADVQELLKTNFQNTLATTGTTPGLSRITEKLVFMANSNFTNPDLEPAANLRITAEKLGKVHQSQALISDWIKYSAPGMPWNGLSADKFMDQWYAQKGNDLSNFVDRDISRMGHARGMDEQSAIHTLPHFASVAEAKAAGYQPGWEIVVNNRAVRIP